MPDDMLFPMTAADVLAKPRAALVKAVETAETSVDKAREKLSKAERRSPTSTSASTCRARAPAGAGRAAARSQGAVNAGADPETGEVS